MSDKKVGFVTLIASLLLFYSLKEIPEKPRLFPVVLLISLSAASIALVVRKSPVSCISFRESAFTVGHYLLFLGYVLVLPFLGFFISTTAYLTLAIIFLKYRHPAYVSGLLALTISFLLKLFFASFFGVSLP